MPPETVRNPGVRPRVVLSSQEFVALIHCVLVTDGSLNFEVQTPESAHNIQAVQAHIFGGRLPPDCLASRVQRYLTQKAKEEREKGLLMCFTGNTVWLATFVIA